MKKTLLFLTATAGMLLLGGVSAKADDAMLDELIHKKVASIGTEVSAIEPGQWYLLVQTRNGTSMAYDAGEGQSIMRATDENIVEVGYLTSHVAQYLLRFVETELTSTQLAKSTVYQLQWGTGRYWQNAAELNEWGTAICSTSTSSEIGNYNVYSVEEGDVYFALAAYDMARTVDNNGINSNVVVWGSDEVTETSSTKAWTILPVELEEMTDADEDYVDISGMMVKSIGEAATSLPTDPSQWYLIMNNRGSGMTPAYDAGEEEYIMRSSLENAVAVGDHTSDIGKYLLRFIPTGLISTSQDCDNTVYNLQWGTGRYWEDIGNHASSSYAGINSTNVNIGAYNMYVYPNASGCFALNAYDMGMLVNNNGAGAILVTWDNGWAGNSPTDYNKWYIYPVELEAEPEAEQLYDVIAQALSLYQADVIYNTSTDGITLGTQTGISETPNVGDGLIKTVAQLSSPYTYPGNDGDGLPALLDWNGDTYWHSDYSSTVADGTHYIQVTLPDSYEGGDVLVRIVRRNNNGNQVTKMSVGFVLFEESDDIETAYSGNEYEIATLDLPYTVQGETVLSAFTCPAGVKYLRFHEQATNSGYGYFHLAEFQLYKIASGNTVSDKGTVLKAAIDAACEAEAVGTATHADVLTLKKAIATYLNDLKTITWTLTDAKYGTLILPFEEMIPEGLTVYTCSSVSGDELVLEEVETGIFAANTPYIIYGGDIEETEQYTFSNEAENSKNQYNKGLLTGTLTAITLNANENHYVLQNQEQEVEEEMVNVLAFYNVATDDITVGANHCYLTYSDDTGGNVKVALNFPGSGVATAIKAVETAPQTGSEAIYDLSGRKVTNPRSGIYIKGGKKVIIK